MGQALDSGALGRLSGGEGAVPPFRALISKPFLMGRTGGKAEIRSQTSGRGDEGGGGGWELSQSSREEVGRRARLPTGSQSCTPPGGLVPMEPPPPPALGHVQEVVVCVTVCSSGLLLPGSTFFLTPSQRHHLADASTFRGRCSILRVGSCEERLAARALKQQPPLTSWLPPLTASVFSKFPWSGSLLCDWAEGAGGLELLRGGLQAGRGAQEFPRAAQRPGNRPV